MQKTSAVVHTAIPFRLDRLPWSRFHLLVVIGLGITWILDGLEVTIVGSLGPSLQSAETLHLSSSNIGAVASFYVIGAVSGALGFGWLDLPPLKWSSLKYDFRTEDKINGEEEAYG